jgi:hypothetical protein
LYFSAAVVSRCHIVPGERVVALEGVVARAQALDPFVERFDALARLDQVVHLATPLRFQELRVRAGELRRKTEVLRVIRDDQEIERPLQLGGQAAARP